MEMEEGLMCGLGRLKDLLDSFKVGYIESKNLDTTVIRCEEGHSGISGVNRSCTDFTFNEDGQFLGMGVYQ